MKRSAAYDHQYTGNLPWKFLEGLFAPSAVEIIKSDEEYRNEYKCQINKQTVNIVIRYRNDYSSIMEISGAEKVHWAWNGKKHISATQHKAIIKQLEEKANEQMDV